MVVFHQSHMLWPRNCAIFTLQCRHACNQWTELCRYTSDWLGCYHSHNCTIVLDIALLPKIRSAQTIWQNIVGNHLVEGRHFCWFYRRRLKRVLEKWISTVGWPTEPWKWCLVTNREWALLFEISVTIGYYYNFYFSVVDLCLEFKSNGFEEYGSIWSIHHCCFCSGIWSLPFRLEMGCHSNSPRPLIEWERHFFEVRLP